MSVQPASSYRDNSQEVTQIKKTLEQTNTNYCKSALWLIGGTVLVASGIWRAAEDVQWTNTALAASGVVMLMLGSWKFFSTFDQAYEGRQHLERIEKEV